MKSTFASISLICSANDCFSETFILVLHRTPFSLILPAFPLTSFQLHFPVSHPQSALLSDLESCWPLQQHYFRPRILLLIGTSYAVMAIFRSSNKTPLSFVSYSYPCLPSCLKYWDMTKQFLLGWCCLHTCPYALSCLFRPGCRQDSSWYWLNLISSLTPTFFVTLKYLMITSRRSQ